MISSSDILRQSNPFESSIQQLLKLDGLKKENLKLQVTNLTSQQKALDDIGKAFSSLQTILTNFTENSSAVFKPLTAASTSDAIGIVSSENLPGTGSFNIEVDQIARRDSVNSSAVEDAGTDLSTAGTGSFEIFTGDSGPVTITVNTAGKTNDEVLTAIRNAINDQAGEMVSASKIQVTDSSSALSIKSSETGSVNRITIQNVQGDFQNLNLDHLFELNELDARFTIDGVEMTRSSNLVENAVEGLSFELKRETSGMEQITVTRNTEEAKKSITSFVEAFNKLNTEIRNNTRLNGDTGERGLLQRERSIRNLSFSLRQSMTFPVQSMSNTPVQMLADLGLEMSQTGTLSVKDESKLEAVLAQEPDFVEQFFTAPDGLLQNLKNSVESSLTGKDNLLDTVKAGLENRINRTNNRIESEERFLIRREEQLRKEFSQLTQIIEQGQAQFNQIMNFQQTLGFFF